MGFENSPKVAGSDPIVAETEAGSLEVKTYDLKGGIEMEKEAKEVIGILPQDPSDPCPPFLRKGSGNSSPPSPIVCHRKKQPGHLLGAGRGQHTCYPTPPPASLGAFLLQECVWGGRGACFREKTPPIYLSKCFEDKGVTKGKIRSRNRE